MKNILFPTDFSKAAEHAFIYALKIASQTGADVTVLHVYNLIEALDIYGHSNLDELYELLRTQKFENYKDSVKPLEKIAKENRLEHVEISYVMKEGLVVDQILEVVESDEIDLVVMGTTGASGLKEVFLGSIAGELLERAPCMTLAVPEKALFDQTIDKIAFTTSFKEEEKLALKKLMDWTEVFNAQVQVVNVDLAHTASFVNRMDQFKSNIDYNDRLTFEVLDGIEFIPAIVEFIERENIDLLAMVTHKRNFIQELFRYSRAKAISYHTDIPILSIPSMLLES